MTDRRTVSQVMAEQADKRKTNRRSTRIGWSVDQVMATLRAEREERQNNTDQR